MASRLLAMRQRGVTLTELLVTVAVIAVVASIAVPSAAPVASFAADAAVGEVVRAIRFAQRESIRTGVPHAARFDLGAQSLRVIRLASNGLEDTTTPLLHPVDKASYESRFGNTSSIGQLASVDFKYKSRSVTNYIAFRPDGTPASVNPADLGSDILERDGKVVVVHGGVQRDVTVSRITGRASF